MNNIMLTIIDIFISLVIESIILSGVFMFISDKTSGRQQQFLQNEMNNIEKQNKFDFEQLQDEIRLVKSELLNEIDQAHAQQMHSIEALRSQHTNKRGDS